MIDNFKPFTTHTGIKKDKLNIGKALFAVSLAAGVIFCTTAPSFAGRFQANHPRAAQLNGRFAQLNTRMTGSYGQLGGHYNQLQQQSNSLQSQMHQDRMANGGYLTRAQQGQFNQQYSQLGQQVSADQAQGAPSGQWMQNHPRQSQVRTGAEGMNSQLSNGYGNLDGHYVGLEHRDNNIVAASQRDAKANGGYLTQTQQQQLDNRETNLQNSINQYSGQ